MKDITILIPVSPIPSHPEPYVLQNTIDSIRERLPDSEIIVMFDGIAPQLMEYKKNYDTFVKNYLWHINFETSNITPIVFGKYSHQSNMVREALKLVKTPYILFCEQDTPLHNDIPFEDLIKPIASGYANTIRFHFEAQIHPEHKYLMLEETPTVIQGVPLLRTRQWSQRPHLSSTDYYIEICKKYWDNQPRFIEHIMYGIIVDGNHKEHLLHIYAPEGTLVRSLHTDGRRTGADSYDPRAS